MLKTSIIVQRIIGSVTVQKAIGAITFGKFLDVVSLTDTTTVSASGVLLCQGYVEAFYFADDYVGDKRIL